MTQHILIGSEKNILDLAKQINFTPEYFYFEEDNLKVVDLGERHQIASIANYLPDRSMTEMAYTARDRQSLQELATFVKQTMVTNKKIKLYLAWYGNEKNMISSKHSIDTQEFSTQELIMNYGELLTVYRSSY